jgi:hypothetical protein
VTTTVAKQRNRQTIDRQMDWLIGVRYSLEKGPKSLMRRCSWRSGGCLTIASPETMGYDTRVLRRFHHALKI